MTHTKQECCDQCDARQIPPVLGAKNCFNPSCPCHQVTTDGTMEERFDAKFKFLLKLANLGAKENVEIQAREELLQFLHFEISRAREEERDIEKKRAILVMAQFVEKKGEDYSLGKYLNMLCALDSAALTKK